MLGLERDNAQPIHNLPREKDYERFALVGKLSLTVSLLAMIVFSIIAVGVGVALGPCPVSYYTATFSALGVPTS